MKLAALSTAFTLMASGVFAGEVAYSSQSEPMAAGAAAMGDTAAWLIPLIAIALIVLASGDIIPSGKRPWRIKPRLSQGI